MKARIQNNRVVDVCSADPATLYHPEVAKDFVDVPNGTEPGMLKDKSGKFVTDPATVEPEPVKQPRVLNKAEIRASMTVDERVALKASTDPYVEDFVEMLTERGYKAGSDEYVEAINKLAAANVLTAKRATELKTLGVD